MIAADLSILIPARNEEFLKRTIEDILSNIEGDTEIIAVLDGYETELPTSPRLQVLRNPESVGQRAATNQACRFSKAKYIMKVDAHCAFDKGFDVKMIEAFKETGDNVTMVPIMRNLHAFDWVCPEGHRRYQSPSGPCKECGKPTIKDVVWIAKTNPQSTSYCFDQEPHFQYFNDVKKRPEYKKDMEATGLTETMSLQGSCFMMTRDKYWELNVSDEVFGSWGSQGIEVACKTWLSGGRVIVNHKTWYAHMFRTQGGDFGFPYPQSGNQVAHAKKIAREIFFDNKWEKQTRPLSWLIEKFWPVPGWTEEVREKIKAWPLQNQKTARPSETPVTQAPPVAPAISTPPTVSATPTKGILYYSDNCLNIRLSVTVKRQIAKSGLPITSVTLKPTNFGKNFVFTEERGYKTMFKQIVKGLEEMKEDIVYFCEHDVLYHPDHFKFTPSDPNTFYYNGNYWTVRQKDGFAVHYDGLSLSGLVVYREAALKHFKERLEMVEKEGFSRRMGFEPFTHDRIKWKFWCPFEAFMPEHPNVDVAHEGNATWKRWHKEQFRRKPKFWEESTGYAVPGWNNLEELLEIPPEYDER